MEISFKRRIVIAFRCTLIGCLIHLAFLILNHTFADAGSIQKLIEIIPPKWAELSITAAMIIFSSMFICRDNDEIEFKFSPLIVTLIVTLIGNLYIPAAIVITVLFFVIGLWLDSIESIVLGICSGVGIFFGYQYAHPDLIWLCWMYIAVIVLVVLFRQNTSLRIAKYITAAEIE